MLTQEQIDQLTSPAPVEPPAEPLPYELTKFCFSLEHYARALTELEYRFSEQHRPAVVMYLTRAESALNQAIALCRATRNPENDTY